jgi:hypothetical protein
MASSGSRATGDADMINEHCVVLVLRADVARFRQFASGKFSAMPIEVSNSQEARTVDFEKVDRVLYFFTRLASVATSYQAMVLEVQSRKGGAREWLVNVDDVAVPNGFAMLKGIAPFAGAK